jgi:hypothetical protein
MPEIIHYWEDISPSLNLSFGAALSAYLGVNIPKDPSLLQGGLLFVTLILLAFFVSTLNVAALRFHQHKLGFSIGYFIQAFISGAFAVYLIYAMDFGAVPAAIILGSWLFHFAVECYVTSPGLGKDSQT